MRIQTQDFRAYLKKVRTYNPLPYKNSTVDLCKRRLPKDDDQSSPF